MTLEDFFGEDEAKVAKQVIVAAVDDSAKAVKGDVEAHKKSGLPKMTRSVPCWSRKLRSEQLGKLVTVLSVQHVLHLHLLWASLFRHQFKFCVMEK